MGKTLSIIWRWLSHVATAVSIYGWVTGAVVLTAVTQWLEPVPLPYFVVALVVVIGVTLMSTAYFSDWRSHRRIDNKVTINLQGVFQYHTKDDPGKCGYRLLFGVFNSHQVPLSMCVKALKWSLSNKSAVATDVVNTQAMLPPGTTTLWSSTIEGLSPNAYDGNFQINLGIGTEFEKQQFELEEIAIFKISTKTEGAIDAQLPFSSKIVKISINE